MCVLCVCKKTPEICARVQCFSQALNLRCDSSFLISTGGLGSCERLKCDGDCKLTRVYILCVSNLVYVRVKPILCSSETYIMCV